MTPPAQVWRRNAMKVMRLAPSKALVVAVLAVLAAGLWWRQGRGPEVGAAPATRGTVVEIVYATGAVEPLRWAKVTSLIRNRILDVCYCEGKTIAKGDVLARLDDREPRAQLGELKAREEFAKREMERVTQLLGRGAATIQTHERLGMDLGQVQALISVQMEKLAYYMITAPMDGLVLRRDGEVGEIAEAGQVLFRVGVPKPLNVVAEVNEVDIPRVAVGQTVLLHTDAFSERRLEGSVREITPMGDAITKTYRIRIALPDDTPLIAGMSVEANVITREKAGALLVPADAVQGASVFVIDGNHLRQRQVVIGIRGVRAVEVISGLKEGERVASPALMGSTDGQRVRPIAPANHVQ
ncbi:MAG TPA: efflux RND transporter periplasmic adaptor subunit [Hyphomicrobiaceae bacterium]|nr:efflux RND transporter periplasmic adaptor subunit [Hyphomicrobiaceae bacterium]